MKARGRRAPYTHVQLRRSLGGWQIFLYGWGLLGATVASAGDIPLGVELAAHVIKASSSMVPLPTVGRPRLAPRKKARIDWNTVELIASTSDDGEVAARSVVKDDDERAPRVFPDRRGRSVVKSLLAGASMKARGRGAIRTHVQLRGALVGWQIFLYGWGLLGAAVASTRDFALGVDLAACVIEEAASQLAGVVVMA